MLTKISSATTIGIHAIPISVEVDLSVGMLQFNIVGLPDTAIRESRQRVMTALKHCGLRVPERKITVNLAPASVKKEGTCFDLPIALGILASAGLLPVSSMKMIDAIVMGELSLDGAIRPVRGVLSVVVDFALSGKKVFIMAPENGAEAAVMPGVTVYVFSHLRDVVAWLRGECLADPISCSSAYCQAEEFLSCGDMRDVRGQRAAKRALQIAAAGGHNSVLLGAPGSGKTMLARRIIGLLPPMCFSELLETSRIYSVSGKLREQGGLLAHRPFRAPHHTISSAGLMGGGTVPQPGEVSLSHNGVLFLDELLEFQRATLEMLRQPLEEGIVHIARAQYSVEYPANFLLIAALNPCPCGFFDDPRRTCVCTSRQIKRYMDRLSGPLIDRIDLHVHVSSMHYSDMHGTSAQEELSSGELKIGIARALTMQGNRWGTSVRRNGSMSSGEIEAYCRLDREAESMIPVAFDAMRLTMRGYHKLLKVARTIADIEGSDLIQAKHLKESFMYRVLDKMKENG